MRPPKEYKNVLRPSVDYLSSCGKLLLDSSDMAKFLGVPLKVIQQLVYTDRIPLPMRLGLGNCPRWNIIEMLQWIECGCPGRERWIEIRGRSGWYPLRRWMPW